MPAAQCYLCLIYVICVSITAVSSEIDDEWMDE